MKNTWSNEAVQFPRLIAELMAVGAFTPAVLRRLSAEMDLSDRDIMDVVYRAQKTWDDIKART